MTQLHPITPQLVAEYKAVRLRALSESPMSFGSTFARESRLTDEEWLGRAARLTNGVDIGFLAQTEGKWSGLALCFTDEYDATQGELISMWVAPEARRHGVGRRLIETIEQWAHRHNKATLKLMVVSINYSAIDFYQTLGFTKTGRTEPYPNDPAIEEYEMSKTL